VSDGAEFSIDLGVEGGSAALSAADALAALSDKLTLAGTAATAASAAVTAGENAYKLAETSANKAAIAVEKIGIAADAQRGKLQAAMDAGDGAGAEQAAAKLQLLTTRQAEAVSKSAAATASMNAEAAALDKLKAAAGAAADKEASLSKQHTAAQTASDNAAKSVKEQADAQTKAVGAAGMLEGAFSKLGGPLGALGQKVAGAGGAFLKMGKSLGEAGPYVAAAVAIVAIAAAVLAVGVASVVATGHVAAWAVGLADAARTQTLLAAGIARSVAGGEELDKTIAGLENKVPATREELLGLAKTLADGGLRGADLSKALEEAAIKAAKLKFGPDFAKQLLSIDNQTARLKKNIAGVFGGLKIDSLLEGMSTLVALFDSTSATGKAIKVVFESLFQPLIDGLTGLLPKIVSTFIQFEIWVLKAILAIKPFGSKILLVAEAFGAIVAVMAVMTAGFAAAIIIPLTILAGLVGVVAAAIGLFVYGIYSAIAAAVSFGASIMGPIAGALEWLTGLSLSELGTQLIAGLVAGITGAGGSVLNAITGIATGAIDAAKNALGIASPSKVFAEIGMHTAAGMTEGVDGGAADVQGSFESMVAPPPPAEASGSGGAPAVPSSGGASPTYYITVHASGGDGPSIASALRDLLADLGAQAGGAVPA
jgi:hypothetical protein